MVAGASASFFSGLLWKFEVLDKVERFATSPYLELLVTTRRSFLLRIDRKPDSSVQTLCNVRMDRSLIANEGQEDSRVNAQASLAKISDAWNFIEYGNIGEADRRLTSIISKNAQSGCPCPFPGTLGHRQMPSLSRRIYSSLGSDQALCQFCRPVSDMEQRSSKNCGRDGGYSQRT